MTEKVAINRQNKTNKGVFYSFFQNMGRPKIIKMKQKILIH